ncbi:phosphoribosylamine--glycine ligase [Candidatus Parcubacteria bacterium]|nr:phosphoribosylamine--glycine ligase [Candidatus Parcubacteria bacterium]
MKLLILGSGGREHALGWKLRQSNKIKELYFLPGNAGTSQIGVNVGIDPSNHKKLIDWVKDNKIDLVVVGPDQYLAEGVVDTLQKAKIRAFGPTKVASEIEWSKSFAKKFMVENNIPTARFKEFSNLNKALKYISKQTLPLVVKADGLALGKGVVIAHSFTEARKAIKEMLADKIFGKAGAKVVIEEYLEGREISIHAFSDGKTIKMFPASQDHKQIGEDDTGPNTGGMGTVSPLHWVSPKLMKEIEKKVVIPTIKGLEKSGRKFVGILYPGIMLTKDGPKVIEFNARFGDPETQTYMRLLDTDLQEILLACVQGKLSKLNIRWKRQYASCVVLASGGYPGKYHTGIQISGMDKTIDRSVVVFHAGTKIENGRFLTNGGRVLNITAIDKTLKKSLDRAYKTASLINFQGKQFRKDIGRKALS